jgi:hypothetical protein
MDDVTDGGAGFPDEGEDEDDDRRSDGELEDEGKCHHQVEEEKPKTS